MSKGTTPRAIRISDELWAAVRVVSAARGDTISDIVRVSLEAYIKQHSEDTQP